MSEAENASLGVIRGTSTYRLVRVIAEGGMGAVYEAQQLGAEGFVKTMAIKTILPHYTNNEEFVEMFIGEAKLVANLVQENIVQIYQLGQDQDGNYYIAMEFVDGINLEQFLQAHVQKNEKIPVELACFICARTCRGLEYAHNKTNEDGVPLGIVHRDVSPKNVMIDSEGTVRLTDFGVAKARRYMIQQEGEVLMGKVEFMSPEQADYQITDNRSDLFSLGIVFYEMVTGVNPFEVEDVYETLERVKSLPIPDPRDYRPDLPEEVVTIIMKALTRDLESRYQTAGEMGYALEYYIYKDGYGPTVQALSKYMMDFWPEHRFRMPTAGGQTRATFIDTAHDTALYNRPEPS
ncbi:MAG: serine/threonine protein kinase [Planctomycetota bacterium]|jgi:serine/threonine-protein kinase